MPLMMASRAKDFENVLSDESALVARIIYDDLDRFLTPVAGETKIKSVGGTFHKACFLVQAYTIEL
ncbi:MAG TPA: hypothetical protein DC054_03995 [Blastocatellia bacterium]|nr:hypothetical protein [Blastocatellia bacterium]